MTRGVDSVWSLPLSFFVDALCEGDSSPKGIDVRS